jgi:hypothetical protein
MYDENVDVINVHKENIFFVPLFVSLHTTAVVSCDVVIPLHTNDSNAKNIKNVQNIRTVLASDDIKASPPERVKQTKGKVINKL